MDERPQMQTRGRVRHRDVERRERPDHAGRVDYGLESA
jgi:hypothetical protein